MATDYSATFGIARSLLGQGVESLPNNLLETSVFFNYLQRLQNAVPFSQTIRTRNVVSLKLKKKSGFPMQQSLFDYCLWEWILDSAVKLKEILSHIQIKSNTLSTFGSKRKKKDCFTNQGVSYIDMCHIL